MDQVVVFTRGYALREKFLPVRGFSRPEPLPTGSEHDFRILGGSLCGARSAEQEHLKRDVEGSRRGFGVRSIMANAIGRSANFGLEARREMMPHADVLLGRQFKEVGSHARIRMIEATLVTWIAVSWRSRSRVGKVADRPRVSCR